MPNQFRLLILLSLVIISGCSIDREAVWTPTTYVEETKTAVPQPALEEEEIPVSLANADVIFVKAVKDPEPNSWTFHVTVQHPDTGWEDYADGWDVVLPGGEVLKPDPNTPFTRLLLHPHEAEQPFARSQSGIIIPEEVTTVYVRAHDLVDGFGGAVVEVNLTVASDSTFEVIR